MKKPLESNESIEAQWNALKPIEIYWNQRNLLYWNPLKSIEIKWNPLYWNPLKSNGIDQSPGKSIKSIEMQWNPLESIGTHLNQLKSN